MARIRSVIALLRPLSLLLLLAAAAACAGCYHMRVNVEPLDREQVSVGVKVPQAYGQVVDLLLLDGFTVDRDGSHAGTIITEFRLFYNERGSGQPEGGRDYYYRLRVDVTPAGNGSEITLEIPALEIRNTYVYDSEGSVRTFSKRYPYDHYPGMFDLQRVTAELQRVASILGRSVR